MTLKLFNTLTKTKELFKPLESDNVRMYVCGPTVYDFAHIGNARPVIVFDVLYRLLRHIYGENHVKYVRNITDVDDKINARAAEEYPDLPLNKAIAQVTTKTTKQFHEDIAALGVLEPDVEPKCTCHIAEMIAMIKVLIGKGNAYEAEGHVLLDVTSIKDYGRLSRRSLDEMIAGARVEVAPYKKNAADSVLWKPSSDEQPGWDSPWGRGRPGWHIECSAMAEKHLGQTFDIHGGGIDLQFPHHENELAQSCAAHGTDMMAKVWMHNGFLQVEGKKMSKSDGNFITIHDLLRTEEFGGRKWRGEVLRLAMLMTHYPQPIDFSVAKLEEAERILKRWRNALTHGSVNKTVLPNSKPPIKFMAALLDDLNTPKAIQQLHDLAGRAFGVWVESGEPRVPDDLGESSWRELLAATDVLGIDLKTLPKQEHSESKKIDTLIAARATARTEKNWAQADRIRDELDTMGIQLKDAKNPGTGEIETTWEVKR